MDDIAIKVENVSKDFHYTSGRAGTIKNVFTGAFKSKEDKDKDIQHALKDISFEIKNGEFFGIVGRNGSGKSTLLKMIAGIYQPNKGKIRVNGKLVPFIELGVGFNPELTGKENVYLNGALLGFSREEIDKQYNEIVEFAELKEFMNQQLKNYSSGMQVRLAFSMAIRAKADILLIDEVLAVGDEAFQKKCYQYFAEIRRKKLTVILVSHNMDAIQQFCTKAMLINKGRKAEIGSPLKIAQLYSELNDESGVTINSSKKDRIGASNKTKTEFINVDMVCNKKKSSYVFDISINSLLPVEDPVIAIGIYKQTGEQVYRWTSDEKIPQVLELEKPTKLRIEVNDVFPVGEFSVNLFVKKRDRSIDYAIFNNIVLFEVNNISAYKHATFWKIPDRTYINGREA